VASAEQPCIDAVSAAPTVPEWITDRPTFAPMLMPDNTMSGACSSQPSNAECTMNAGCPSTDQAGASTPGSAASCTRTRRSSTTANTDAPTPVESTCGAATITSNPAASAPRASATSPGESMPSSLVISARTSITLPTPASGASAHRWVGAE
jgi:hypothetical protein